ncbi:MAG: hypothetical protein R2850_01590 [Bacteroidia bacterium]
MRLRTAIFCVITSIICSCGGNSVKNGEESGRDSGLWRSSEILTNSNYFSLFSDSLRDVRAQSSLAEGDSLLREMILNESYLIPNDKLLEILRVYKRDFNSIPVAEAFADEELAVTYLQLSRFDSVKYYAEEAGLKYKRLKIEDGVARTEMIQAAALSFSGKFDKANEHQLVALDIYKQSGDSAGIYGVLAEMSVNSFHEKQFRKSIEIAHKVLRYAESVKDSFLLGDMLNTLGNAYHQINIDDESARYTLNNPLN